MDHEEWAPAAFQQQTKPPHVDPVNIDPDSCGIYEEESDQAPGAPSWLARDFQTMLSNGLRCFPEC